MRAVILVHTTSSYAFLLQNWEDNMVKLLTNEMQYFDAVKYWWLTFVATVMLNIAINFHIS